MQAAQAEERAAAAAAAAQAAGKRLPRCARGAKLAAAPLLFPAQGASSSVLSAHSAP